MKITSILLALALGLCSVAAFAAVPDQSASLDYNYVQGQYQFDSVRGGPTNTNTFGGVGSVAITPSWFIQGSANRTLTSNGFPGSNDFRLGLGGHVAVSGEADLYSLVSVINKGNVSDEFRTRSSYGYAGEVGTRVLLTDTFQAKLGVSEERDNFTHQWNTYGLVGVQYNIAKQVGLTADVKAGQNDRIAGVGVRYEF